LILSAPLRDSSGTMIMVDPAIDVLLWSMLTAVLIAAWMVVSPRCPGWDVVNNFKTNRRKQKEDAASKEITVKGDIWAKLPLVPWWGSLYAMAMYAFLWGCGVAHFLRAVGLLQMKEKQLRGDMALLCVIYAVECGVALVYHRSTMYGWRTFDFLAHHLPFVVVVGLALVLQVPVSLFPFTWALDPMLGQ